MSKKIIKTIPPSGYKGKSIQSLRKAKRSREKAQNPETSSMACDCPACLEQAEKLYDLKKRDGYFIQQKQDRPVWMPLLELEKRCVKNLVRSYKHIKLCKKHEPLANEGWVRSWAFVPRHTRSGFPGAERNHNRRSGAGAGADFKTVQDLQAGNIKDHLQTAGDDSNTDMETALYYNAEQNLSFEEQENWRLIAKMYFPPHHTRKGIQEIARELNLDPSYVSRVVGKMKEKVVTSIEQLLLPQKENEKKFILFQYYLEQKTQAEIAEMIGRKTKDVQRIIRRYKKKIAENLKKSGVFGIGVEGSFFWSNG